MTAIIDNEMLWRQFNTAIDSLRDALRDCPADLWEQKLWQDEPDQWVAAGFSAFWYLGYHTLFWPDLYLTGAEEGFAPPASRPSGRSTALIREHGALYVPASCDRMML